MMGQWLEPNLKSFGVVAYRATHGSFTSGKDAHKVVHNAAVLEFIARLASEKLRIKPKTKPAQSVLLATHFLCKHGPKAYYGQK